MQNGGIKYGTSLREEQTSRRTCFEVIWRNRSEINIIFYVTLCHNYKAIGKNICFEHREISLNK